MAIHLNLGVQNLNGSIAMHTQKPLKVSLNGPKKRPKSKLLDPKKMHRTHPGKPVKMC